MNLYSLFLTIGVLAGLWSFLILAKKLKLPTGRVIENIFWIFLIGFLGARLTYIILYPSQFSSLNDLIAVWQGGLVSFGGMLLGFLTAIYLFKGQTLMKWLDILITSFFLGWVFGRIGGFLTANAVGNINPSFGPLFYYRVPIQLFEATFALIIFIFNLFLLKKTKLKSGIIFYLNILFYSLGRLIIDFWRDSPDLIIGLNSSQIFSLLLVLCGIILLIKHGLNRQN